MTYTWGYIKENTLSKLNISEDDALQLGFLSRFPYQANEAMTQICSAIKPKNTFLIVEVVNKKEAWNKLVMKYNVCEVNNIIDEKDDDYTEYDDDYEQKKSFWAEWNKFSFVNEPMTMPEDFISFSDDVSYMETNHDWCEVGDDSVRYYGYNQLIFKSIGKYRIPYNGRWFFFTKTLDNTSIITAPADIIECLPSYMASQCLKIDDENKASIFRNEYEIFLARIDDTDFGAQRSFKIGGNW